MEVYDLSKLLKAENISMNYHTKSNETKAIDNVSFTTLEGEFISIVGPSGCGKSTLLSIVAGLLKPSSGKVYINDEKITGVNSSVGYMFQQDQLLEWRSILSNVYLGLEIQGKLTEENKNHVDALLTQYGLSNFKNHHPSQLSGGMRQRVALIRTLALDPNILLLDEPFSALDYQSRLNVADEVYSIIKNENKTAILVTHDIAEAISMSNKVIVLSPRPAKVNKIFYINFNMENRTPFKTRSAPEFKGYFNLIWKELNSNE